MACNFTLSPISDECPAEKVAVQVNKGSLYPVLPQHTGRYDVAKRATRSPTLVSAGMFAGACTPAPLYLPQSWSAHTHPEGKVYFYREGPFKVVTDTYLYNSEASERILSWVQIIETEMVEKSVFLPPDAVELYVQLEDGDCNYYFADHTSRSLFWLDGYNSADLGLLDVVSPSHLKLQLEEHYWTHVEYHCMHTLPFTAALVEEAISQLIHACGDQMTSSSSTFPYTFQESKNLLDILTPARRQVTLSGYVITTIARLFNMIAHARYWSHYGQEQARLSRDTAILPTSPSSWSIASTLGPSARTLSSTLTFKLSTDYERRLNTIFTDDFVYAADWQSFTKRALKRWRSTFAQSLALLALHAFFVLDVPSCQPLAIASSGMLGLSIASSVALTHTHEDLEEGTASDAFQYLTNAKRSFMGLGGLAVIFGLPQALSLWGMILMLAQAPLALLNPTHLYALASALVALASMCIICRAIFARRTSASEASEPSCDGSAVDIAERETENKSIV